MEDEQNAVFFLVLDVFDYFMTTFHSQKGLGGFISGLGVGIKKSKENKILRREHCDH